MKFIVSKLKELKEKELEPFNILNEIRLELLLHLNVTTDATTFQYS